METVHGVYEHYAQASLDDSSTETFVDSLETYISEYFLDCREIDTSENRDGSFSMKAVFKPSTLTDHMRTIFKSVEGMINAFSHVVLEYRLYPGVLTLVFRKVDSEARPETD